MISVIILTTKSQGFSPFGGSESLKESPPPVWMVPMSHALGLRGFNARINCTWRWHQFGADESNYGTSHPDCGSIQRWQQKSIFFDKVFLHFYAVVLREWEIILEKPWQEKSTAVWICAGHHNLLWIQHHQRRTNDKWLTKQIFRSHEETHPQLPLALGTKNQSRLATNTNIIDGPSWLLTWYLQHLEKLSETSTSPVSKFLRARHTFQLVHMANMYVLKKWPCFQPTSHAASCNYENYLRTN